MGSESLYAVAMLRVALELKKDSATPIDEIIAGVSARMRLDEPDFRAFLSQNLGLIQAAAPAPKPQAVPVSRPATARPRRTPRG